MPRLGILNMLIGFSVLAFAAAAGAFLATDITAGYLHDKALLETWRLLLLKSAHGHTNLFGTLHVLLGLTLPYSALKPSVKKAQTIGLLLGTLAMGPGMMIRAFAGPFEGVDATEGVIGLMLTAALAALATHAYGLGLKLMKRA